MTFKTTYSTGATSYSEMVSTPERRATFIQSVVEMIQEHNFDGLDLDPNYTIVAQCLGSDLVDKYQVYLLPKIESE